MTRLSQDLLLELLLYDYKTGRLTWRERGQHHFKNEVSQRRWNTKWAGKEAFAYVNPYGYRYGRVLRRYLPAHQVIWVMIHGGEFREIDHKNGVRDDNRLENLRAATRTENNRNCAHQKNNTSGVMGVYFNPKNQKWFAKIVVDRKQIHLGTFETIEQAAHARKKAEAHYGFSERHGAIL